MQLVKKAGINIFSQFVNMGKCCSPAKAKDEQLL
jgi:hypothetical protein